MEFSDQKKEDLILQVERFPCLYNKAVKEYSNKDVREAAWREIARFLEITGKLLFFLLLIF